MKALIYTQYGTTEVLQLKNVEKPSPKDDEVLIKVHAASLNSADWKLLQGKPFLVRLVYGLMQPRHQILGADVAGTVEAIGKNVTTFKVGEAVFGDLSSAGLGAFAEYVCAPEKALVHKPVNLSFEEAAAVPLAGITALQALRNKAPIRPGHKVAINGASGGVGTYAVQIAKAFGAHVTAICSPQNIDMLRSLDADQVIDYTREDFTKNGQRYDLILAANGYHPLGSYRRVLAPGGTYVMVGGSTAQLTEAIFLGALMSLSGVKMTHLLALSNQDDLRFMKELIEAGKVKPILSHLFTLDRAIEAFQLFSAGHAQGKIVIKVC